MSERDPVVTLLKKLDRPVAPRPEFADALLARLLEDLAETDGRRARRPVPRPRFAFPARRRRPVLAGAVALAALAAAVSAVVLSRPAEASALDVIHEARESFATAPPFQATLHVDFNPDGSSEFAPQGSTATVVVSYGGPTRFRTEIVDVDPRVQGANAPGSYQVFDGQRIGTYDPRTNRFLSGRAPAELEPLEFLSWRGAYPDWEQVCRGPASEVLPDGVVAGREARHIRCGDFKGGAWELWIDRETGLLLKIVGQVGGGDFFLGIGASQTSAKGGFEVEQVRFNPSFPPGTFKVAGPAGALDYGARLESAMAKVPPFRAVFAAYRRGAVAYVDEAWWMNAETWRREVLVGSKRDPRGLGGAGSFFVSAGGSLKSYNAQDNTWSEGRVSAALDPVIELLPESDLTYMTENCPVVGHKTVLERDAVHRRCKAYDVWIDASTGVALRKHGPRFELRVRRIEYSPTFPAGTFQFVPPPGSRNADEAESDPFYKTKLEIGRPAPSWQAKKLDGRAFELADLRGKPALLLLFPDWCPPEDPVCEVFGPLKQAYERSGKKVAVVWVDIQGSAAEARKVVSHNDLTFLVVVDAQGSSLKAWGVQAWPFWLLLDSKGSVVDARLKPQTRGQLEELLAEAR